MKTGTKLHYTKRRKIKGLKRRVRDVVDDCLSDIAPYIVTDILNLLKKMGIIYAKTAKTNKKESKKKR